MPGREAFSGQFGLLSHWANDYKFGRRTFNARSENAATLPSFRDAEKWGRKYIIPAAAFYEPDWRSGKGRCLRALGGSMVGLWVLQGYGPAGKGQQERC